MGSFAASFYSYCFVWFFFLRSCTGVFPFILSGCLFHVLSFAWTIAMDSLAGLFSMPFFAAQIFMGLSPGAFSVRFFAVIYCVHSVAGPFLHVFFRSQGFSCIKFRKDFTVGSFPMASSVLSFPGSFSLYSLTGEFLVRSLRRFLLAFFRKAFFRAGLRGGFFVRFSAADFQLHSFVRAFIVLCFHKRFLKHSWQLSLVLFPPLFFQGLLCALFRWG